MGHLSSEKLHHLQVSFFLVDILLELSWRRPQGHRVRVIESYNVEIGLSAQLPHTDQHIPSILFPPACISLETYLIHVPT